MSTSVRGGGLRSMGASLLDQVLAETLDPAYAQAAEARAAREAADGPEERTAMQRRRSGRLRARLLVAVVLAIGGLLAAMTYNQAAAGANGRQQVRSALLGDIEKQQKVSDGLSSQLQRLQRQVSQTRDKALAATEVGQTALDRLGAAEQAAAAVPVKGPGLLVTLADAKPNADADPVGGQSATDPRGKVQDGDLQLVVNALWAAGAEAVSINGQRLGPTSTIRFAGEAVLVDFNPVSSPYRVSAIGNRTSLSRLFLASPDVSSLAVISESFGLRFDIAQEGELSLPAATPVELRSARPLAPAGPTSGTAPPASSPPSSSSASSSSASASSAGASRSSRPTSGG